MWCGHEDGLHVSPHVQLCEESVTLVEDEVLYLGQIEHLIGVIEICVM